MRLREFLWLLLALLFLLVLSRSTAEETYDHDLPADLFSEDEYPPDMDTLEEFIQSYYLLLESNEYLDKYKFINYSKNELHDPSAALAPFYRKLLELRSGLRDRVSIYQLGDSHIQSGYFSGTARSSLQEYFGNAGRGLVFPLRLAGTNQPDDYKIISSNGFSRDSSPNGISGYNLGMGSKASLQLSTNNFFGLDSKFNKLSVLMEATGGTLEVSQQEAKRMDLNLGKYKFSSLAWEQAVNSISLSIEGDSSTLYGLMLETANPGLLYHSAGINGAGFYNLADSSRLFEQLSLLNPDLIVISLGTNDAQGNYRNDVFAQNLQRFMNLLRTNCPEIPVIFTLPPDSHKRGKHNADLAKVEKVIADYAKDNRCAWWDLGKVMGGKNSVSKWRKEQMASKDLLHYTPKGYMLQGYLFYQAIVKAYKSFSETPGEEK